MLIYCVLACFIASQVKNLNVYRENHTQRIIYIFDPPPQLEEKKIVEKKDCRGGMSNLLLPGERVFSRDQE